MNNALAVRVVLLAMYHLSAAVTFALSGQSDKSKECEEKFMELLRSVEDMSGAKVKGEDDG